MPIAKSENTSRKKTSLILTILVLSTGLISAALLILLNKNQASKTPAAIPIEPLCPLEGSCRWNAVGIDGIVYKYTVTDKTTGKAVKDDRTSATQIQFPVEANHTYECTVAALSSCGQGDSSSVSCTTTTTSVQQSPPPTVTSTPTPQASVTVTATPTPNLNQSSASTSSISGTPTPTTKPGSSPTPTSSAVGGGSNPSPTSSSSASAQSNPTATPILIVQATNTPGPSATSGPTTVTSATTSLPQAGTLLPTLAVLSIASVIIIIGLLL